VNVCVTSLGDPVLPAAPGLLASGRLAGPGDDDDDEDETPIGDPPDDDEDGDWDDEDDDEDEEPLQAMPYCTAASPWRRRRGTIAHHRFVLPRGLQWGALRGGRLIPVA
jgi:hypothetical protein